MSLVSILDRLLDRLLLGFDKQVCEFVHGKFGQ